MQPAGAAVYGGFGLTEFGDCDNGEIRGVTQFNETLYAVSGDKLSQSMRTATKPRLARLRAMIRSTSPTMANSSPSSRTRPPTFTPKTRAF